MAIGAEPQQDQVEPAEVLLCLGKVGLEDVSIIPRRLLRVGLFGGNPVDILRRTRHMLQQCLVGHVIIAVRRLRGHAAFVAEVDMHP